MGELGRGGASIVFRALGPDGRIVALKLLRHESADAAARFAREVRLQAALGEEDGFVPLLASGESPHGSYLVMPFMTGGTLRQRLRGRALDPNEAVALLSTLAGTVGRAHARGIVHRDLKPENVLFTQDGRPLVADLGLAKRFETKGSQSVALSRTTDGRGTIGYMAPEQLEGARDVKPPADVFALGAILYECLAGEPAFRGESEIDVLVAVAEHKVRPLRKAAPGVPRWLERVVERALAHDARARFQDGAALAAALVPARPRSLRGPLAVAALLVAGIALAFALGSRSAPPSDPLADARHAFEAAHTEAEFLAAARSFESAGPLSPADERRHVAALALGGRPDVASLARLQGEPDVRTAVVALYERALAGTAPVASLLVLEKLAVPAALRARVAAAWIDETLERADLGVLQGEVFALTTPFISGDALSEKLRAVLGKIGHAFEALGRATAADPMMDPYPKRLGPFFTLVRLLRSRVRLTQQPEWSGAWRKALEPIHEHPFGLYMGALLDVSEGVRVREAIEAAHRALDGLERAKERTTHLRAIAHELVAWCFGPNAQSPGGLDELLRCARYADFKQTWGDVPKFYKPEGPLADEIKRRDDAAEWIPRGVWELPFFVAANEDPH